MLIHFQTFYLRYNHRKFCPIFTIHFLKRGIDFVGLELRVQVIFSWKVKFLTKEYSNCFFGVGCVAKDFIGLPI